MAEQQSGSARDMTWQQVFRVWWLLAWRGLLGFMIFVAIIGGVIKVLLDGLGASQEVQGLIGTIIGLVVYVVWGMVIVRMAINKSYRDFRLAYTPH